MALVEIEHPDHGTTRVPRRALPGRLAAGWRVSGTEEASPPTPAFEADPLTADEADPNPEGVDLDAFADLEED